MMILKLPSQEDNICILRSVGARLSERRMSFSAWRDYSSRVDFNSAIIPEFIRDWLQRPDRADVINEELIPRLDKPALLEQTLALVHTGHIIEFDVPNRTNAVLASEDEQDCRRAEWKPRKPYFEKGYGWVYVRKIKQENDV